MFDDVLDGILLSNSDDTVARNDRGVRDGRRERAIDLLYLRADAAFANGRSSTSRSGKAAFPKRSGFRCCSGQR